MLFNPVFIALILSVLAYGEYRLQKYLDAKLPQGTQKKPLLRITIRSLSRRAISYT